MKPRVDLHMHTTCSDGALSPSELLERVRRSRLVALSVTDHDTVAGYLAVRDLLSEGDPELIPGLELSCTHGGRDLHMLGYLIDSHDSALTEALMTFQERRNQRGRLIVEKLGEMGIDLTFEDVERAAQGGVIGRPHVAEALHRRGATATYEAAFHKYIGDKDPAYVPKTILTPLDAIRLIHRAGGVAVLAHPVINDVREHIEALVGMGLDGVEVYHPDHKVSDTDNLKHLAARFGLVWTGGSDFHGRPGHHDRLACEPVPSEVVEHLKARASQIRGSK